MQPSENDESHFLLHPFHNFSNLHKNDIEICIENVCSSTSYKLTTCFQYAHTLII